MPNVLTQEVNKPRLILECEGLGLSHKGLCRADLVSTLLQAGVYTINTSLPPRIKMQDINIRFPNHSSVLIGNGAQLHSETDNLLIISNNKKNVPLIKGEFDKHVVTLANCLNLENTKEVSPQLEGKEGDIRRNNSNLYMYRSTDVVPGWYPISFGSVTIV